MLRRKTAIMTALSGAPAALIIYIIKPDPYIPLGIIIGIALAIWRLDAFLSLMGGYIAPTSTANIIAKAGIYPMWNILLILAAIGMIYLLKPTAALGLAIGLGIYGVIMPIVIIAQLRKEVPKT